MDEAEAVAAIEEIYAQLPTVDCQGMCWDTCGGIDMSPLEHRRIAERGFELPQGDAAVEWAARWTANEPVHCPALGKDRRCQVHDVRPLICRAWGVGRGQMACPHGCTVHGRRLSGNQLMRLQGAVAAIGGPFHGLTGTREGDRWLDALDDPRLKPLMARFHMGERGPIEELILEVLAHIQGEMDGVS